MSKSIQFKCGKEENAYVHPFWPIGSIYLSLDETNPNKWFGGTWERIKDRFLLACGDAYANGATGGEASHKLVTGEIPSHSHNLPSLDTYGKNYTPSNQYVINTRNLERIGTPYAMGVSLTDDTGGNQAHNNMPPYLAIYVWKRVA